MDFHSLTRKELQKLCKKNKIPANQTNVAMADTLASLQHVEGLEEFLKETEFQQQQFSEEAVIGSPDVQRTSCRTSTRRKPMIEEPESSQILNRTHRATRRGVAEEVNREKTEVAPETPAARSTRRAPPVSARQKTATQKDESSLQRTNGTRRSVRLLGKSMEELSLAENGKIQPFKIDGLSKGEIADDSSITMSGTNMKTSSEVCSEKTEDLEVSSALKSDGSPKIQMDLSNDVQEKNEDHVQEKSEDHVSELQVLKSDSEPADFVDNSEEKVENFDDKDVDSVQLANPSNETQNSHAEPEDTKAGKDLGSGDSSAAHVSDGVSADVITQDTAPKSSLKLEESDSSTVKESVEPIPLNLSSSNVQTENSENVSSEASAKSKSPTLKSPAVAEDDYQGNFDFESESPTEKENAGDSSEDESVDSEASNENSPKRLEHISDNKVESGEKVAALVDHDISVVEAEVAMVEDKCDFESESVTEEETDDAISEEESGESEASEDEVTSSEEESGESEASEDEVMENEASDGESTDSEIVSDDDAESEETKVEASLVDAVVAEAKLDFSSLVDVVVAEAEAEAMESEASDKESTDSEIGSDEADVAIKTQTQFNSHDVDSSIQNSISSGDLVDVCVVSAEEFITITSAEGATSLKEMSPAQHIISGSEVSTKSPLPTFSADQFSGQFPRPTLPTPGESSSKPHPVIQMITFVLDENEENTMALPPAGGDEAKKNENPTDDNSSMLEQYDESTSLRQLQKMLKEKLQVRNEKKRVKPRVALQTLPENLMAADEPQREN